MSWGIAFFLVRFLRSGDFGSKNERFDEHIEIIHNFATILKP